MKRFYQRVEVAAEGAAHRVLLDGRPLRTPARQPLALPSAALAAALAREWQAQGEVIRPHAMPLTRLASTAHDRMPGLRAGGDRGGGRLRPHRSLVLSRRRIRSSWSSASSTAGSRCSTGRRRSMVRGSG